MIFVTVGTHEQPFDRLVKAIDDLVGEGKINEEVIIQRGYSKYLPKHCKYFDLLPWQEMKKYYEDARIIITHGGPASFIDALSIGKTPIVVPRQSRFNEHINDHQLIFTRELIEYGVNIILIENVNDLLNAINGYKIIKSDYVSKTNQFNNSLIAIVSRLFESKD